MPSEEQIKAALTILEAAEEEQGSSIKKVLVINKTLPKGWNPETNSPYYREKFALDAQREIDRILLDKETAIKLRPKDCKLVTLYQRIVQGRLYLIDHLDTTDKKYALAKPHIEIKRLKEENVVVMFWRDVAKAERLTYETELGENSSTYLDDSIAKWKKDLEDFIDYSNDGDTFYRRALSITEDDQIWVRTILMPLGQFHIKKMSSTTLEIKHKDLSKHEAEAAA